MLYGDSCGVSTMMESFLWSYSGCQHTWYPCYLHRMGWNMKSSTSKKGSTNHSVSAYHHWSPKRVQQITLSVLTVIGLQKGFNKSPSQCLPYLLWLEIMIRLNTVHHLDLFDVVQKSWALLGWQLMARNHAFHWYLWKNNKNHHSLVDHV